jgi:WD40 repeat protein
MRRACCALLICVPVVFAAGSTCIAGEPKPAARVDLYGDRGTVFSPNGDALAIGTWKGDVRLLSTATGKALSQFHAEQRLPQALAFSPDGKRIASADAKAVHFWDGKAHTALGGLPAADDPIRYVVLSPAGKVLVVRKEPACRGDTGVHRRARGASAPADAGKGCGRRTPDA